MAMVFLFDLGGVVCFENRIAIEDCVITELGITKQNYLALSRKYMPAVTKGEITLLEFYQKIITQTHARKTPKEIIKTRISTYKKTNMKHDKTPKEILNMHISAYKKTNMTRDKRIVALIKKIRKTYNVACLTNTEPEIAKINRQTGLFNLFDKSYLSTEIGDMKPNPRIYKKVINDLKTRPSEIIYIDDRIENVKAGRRQGLNSIHYKGYNELEREVRRYKELKQK
jgi:HAD superfamily hydrolase (TIGR01509 family)